MNRLANDLRAARALIDTPEKWVQGAFKDDAGCLCAVGAMRFGIGGSVYASKMRQHQYERYSNAHMAVFGSLPQARWGSVVAFNDDPATTHADVMSLFSRAIASAEAQS